MASLHEQWLGMLQPEGLVVAIPVIEERELWVRLGPEPWKTLREFTPDDRLPDLDTLLALLDWPDARVTRDTERWRLDLPDLGATLQPDAVLMSGEEASILCCWTEGDLDGVPSGSRWPAPRQERFERLLVAKGVAVGLHVSPSQIRLTYAPSGEAPGRLTWPVEALRSSEGRLLVDALHMLLGKGALFLNSEDRRLHAVLAASRKGQERVTAELAGQVEEALRLLLEGFDAADRRAQGQVLQGVESGQLYEGLSTVLLRLVFLLYAEDKGLLPLDQPLYAESYSLTGLAEELSRDAVRYHGAMDRRFGAWSRLLTLFRLIFDGGEHHALRLPPRQGELFDPDRFPFLEGRAGGSHRTDRARVPRVDDGVVAAVLQRLLYLRSKKGERLGQRLSYRNLEVEQIGSVYENLMAFEVERTAAPSLVLEPEGQVVDLVALREASDPVRHLAGVLGDKPAKTKKTFGELAGFEATEDREADLDRLEQALASKRRGDRLSPGRHVLVPGPQRRHSGSHYTPRSLTEPIVRHTLEPLLGEAPTPEQILALKVCDPAMGSGAFLAEACRFLAKRLVEAWTRADTLPMDHDPELLARRLVAEQCLYGVDKNPRAVTLARLSIWLVTSAADRPFTFVDHALREGDALIGCSVEQMAHFDLHPGKQAQPSLWSGPMRSAMHTAKRLRANITAKQRELPLDHRAKSGWLREAEREVWDERQVGDALLACHWAGGTKGAKKKRLAATESRIRSWYPSEEQEPLPDAVRELVAELPMRPFHWELEFPEVFTGKSAGFDAVVGNPPFMGKHGIASTCGDGYIQLLLENWPHAHGKADLAAWFFLQAPQLLRQGGCFGLISTNSVSQGASRTTGLQHLLSSGFELYRAVVDMPWPVAGAAVTVSVVHGVRGSWSAMRHLRSRVDGTWRTQAVPELNSALEGAPELRDPVALRKNSHVCFQGNNIVGIGFTLDPTEAKELKRRDARNAELIRPYLGGKEVNSSPDLEYERLIIDFGDQGWAAAQNWPDLIAIVEARVRPDRDRSKRAKYRERWWQFGEAGPARRAAIASMPGDKCLVCSQVSKHLLVARLPKDWCFSHALNVFALSSDADFAILQSRVHEHWARAMGSSMKTDLRYTPSSCFMTFPFPRPTPAQQDALTRTGKALYDKRFAIMQEHRLGMTQVWNCLHGQWPKNLAEYWGLEEDIEELRVLRDEMDRAVLAAYGWDLDPDDKEGIIAELRKLNAARAAEEAAGA